MTDQLEILSTSGVCEDALSGLSAYIGVSFSMTRYFSKPRMQEYIDWAGGNVRNLLIIVADHFEGYNIQVFKNSAPEDAFPRALKAGADLVKGYDRVVPERLRSRITIALASDLLENSQCRSVLQAVCEEARRNAAFLRDCRDGILEMISGKLDANGLYGWARENALNILHNYMYEEIALILYICHVMEPAWPVAIFPYSPRKVITNIYDGKYGQRLLAITNNQPFRFVRLAAPSFEMAKASGFQN